MYCRAIITGNLGTHTLLRGLRRPTWFLRRGPSGTPSMWCRPRSHYTIKSQFNPPSLWLRRCRKNLPLGVRRLTENPYESPTAPTSTAQRQRSFRRYAIASIFTITCWIVTTALLFLLGLLNFADGNVLFEYTPSPSSGTPLGGPTISTHLFYVDAFSAILIWCAAVVLTLAAVNGFITFWRHNADA